MKRFLQIILGLTMTLSVTACGSDGGSAQGIFQGQQFQLGVQDVRCVAGPATGPALSGDGVLDAPLVCTISFDTDNFFSDFIQITVSDVRPVFANGSAWQILDGNLISVRLTLSGIPQPIFGGLIRFTEISNVAGHRTCADYQVQTGDGEIQGNFCGKVRLGF